MTTELRVYANDLTSLIATLDQPYNVAWSRELLATGAASFTIPHDSPVLQANPTILDGDNLVIVRVDGTDRYPFLIRSRSRDEGETWDPITVTGLDAIELMRLALVYPPFGVDGILLDNRLFAWQGLDYETTDPGWVDPPQLGTYSNPTADSLNDITTGTNEIQTVTLNADTSGFPWPPGNTYPSPGGLPGTWTLTFDGNTTSALAHTASLAQIKAALEALPNIDGVTVGGTGPTSSFTVEFDGADVAGKQQPLLSIGHSQLRHGATSVTRTQAGDKAIEGNNLLEGWPDPDAQWLGAFGVTWHLRRVLKFGSTGHPVAQPVRLYVAGPQAVEVWWDGDFLGETAGLDVGMYDIDASAHNHVLAIRSDGPVLASVTSLTDEGEVGGVLYRTASGYGRTPHWEGHEGDPPGVTAGYMLKTIFDEAAARGFLPPVSIDFTDTLDSNGVAWTSDVEMGVQVGNDSVLSIAERLRDVGVFVEMAPDLTMSAWQGDRSNKTGTVSLALTDVHNKYSETEDELLTALLVRTEDSWVERHRAGPRREGFLSLGNVPTDRGAQVIADAVLDEFEAARESFGWSYFSDQPGVPAALAAFQMGDLITGPKLATIVSNWTTGAVRVDTIACEIQDNGKLLYTCEVSA